MSPAFYQNQNKFFVSVDGIILGFRNNELNVLVTNRKFEPQKGQPSLMGGFIQEGESLHASAIRVIEEYTGLQDLFIEQIGAYGEIGRDEGERVISVAYYALINMELFDENLEKEHNAEWVNVKDVKILVFDHNQMLKDAIRLLQRKASNRPIGFNLLPEKFTLPQLQSLYEAIYQTPIDKRNFRKKLLAMDILEKSEEKDKSASKRGAFYYTFNKEKYDNLLEKGFYFSL